jgi:hypothetical protein
MELMPSSFLKNVRPSIRRAYLMAFLQADLKFGLIPTRFCENTADEITHHLFARSLNIINAGDLHNLNCVALFLPLTYSPRQASL